MQRNFVRRCFAPPCTVPTPGRACNTRCRFAFDRCRIESATTQRCLNAGVSLSLAEGACEEAVPYCRGRPAFDRPAGNFQDMRFKPAETSRDIEVGRSVLRRLRSA